MDKDTIRQIMEAIGGTDTPIGRELFEFVLTQDGVPSQKCREWDKVDEGCGCGKCLMARTHGVREAVVATMAVGSWTVAALLSLAAALAEVQRTKEVSPTGIGMAMVEHSARVVMLAFAKGLEIGARDLVRQYEEARKTAVQ